MKYFLSIFLLCFCLSNVLAQEKHFVFIQSDNNQPFYVLLSGKLLSSTATGYVIIPKLANSNYNISIGFAKNAFPEQSFQFVIENKDLGFTLKNFGEKGWGLSNLQSLAVMMAEVSNTNEVAKAINEKAAPKDDFEPLISFNKKIKDTPAETDSAANTLSDEPEAATNEIPKDQEVNPDNAVTKENNNITDTVNVQKVSEMKDADGVHLSYAEDNGKKTDTIHVIIPSANSASNTENISSETNNTDSNVATSSEPAASENGMTTQDSVKFPDVNTDKSKKDATELVTADKNIAITNSKCKNIATGDDYARLRRKMAMETSDEKMINVAKKIYRNKCFTTSQIKKLSTLFLSDEGRYNFFNTSYNSAADASEYSTLQSEFIDPAFVNRFKAMLQ